MGCFYHFTECIRTRLTAYSTNTVPVDDFIKWNPSLSYDPKNPSSCVLAKGVRYCVKPGNGADTLLSATMPHPTASLPTTLSKLSSKQPPSSPQSPYSTPSPSISPSQSNTINTAQSSLPQNPSLTSPSPSDATPTPTQPGVITSCKNWHLVVSGDGCPSIAQKYSIDVSDFKKWNPRVKEDCTLLETGFNVCVAV